MANNNHIDVLALERVVLHETDTEVRDAFARSLIRLALRERGIAPPPEQSSTYQLLLSKVAGSELPLGRGRTVDAIVRELEQIRRTGLVRARVEQYALKNEIEPRLLTPRVKQGMVEYLLDLGVVLDSDQRFEAGAYDEYLAMAYANAVRSAGDTLDPIVAARTKSAGEPWDYTVRYFDELDGRAVVPEFVRRAGVLDYVYHVGDVLGVFRLAEHVLELWDYGVIDVEDGPTEALFFNYQQNALQRGTPERRALEYKRVLNLGNATLLEGVVYNEPFPRYWARLMREAARYRELIQSQHEIGHVSRQPIVRAIRDLQNNLTEFAGGGTGKTAQKLYAQLEDAMHILGAPEVVEQLAMGRRKGLFRVIERLYKDVYKRGIDANAVYDLAKAGDQIFTFLANFTDSTADEEFDRAITLMEDWVLLEAALLGEAPAEEAAGEEAAVGEEDDGAAEEAAEDTETAEW